jgi:hypothetical protein
MKRIFTFLFGCMCVVALHAQDDVLIANFDDVFPDIGSFGGVTLDYAPAPEGSLASGQMLVVGVPANNQAGSFTITMNEPIDPHNYVGISFDAQISEVDNVPFILKLQQSSDPNHSYTIQDWSTNPNYSGGGEWQEVRIPFDVVIAQLDNTPAFPADQYDQIEIAPASYSNFPTFTLNMDNVMLRASWGDESGIPLMKVAAFAITAVNGTISATGANGNPVSLKVYSPSGQEIVEGVNQVQVETKGVYIVKATNGKVSSVSKIIVH